MTETNKRIADNSLNTGEAASALAAWEKVDSVLGVGTKGEAEVPAEISALAEARTAAKKAKDFKKSDAIRDELNDFKFEDTGVVEVATQILLCCTNFLQQKLYLRKLTTISINNVFATSVAELVSVINLNPKHKGTSYRNH